MPAPSHDHRIDIVTGTTLEVDKTGIEKQCKQLRHAELVLSFYLRIAPFPSWHRNRGRHDHDHWHPAYMFPSISRAAGAVLPRIPVSLAAGCRHLPYLDSVLYPRAVPNREQLTKNTGRSALTGSRSQRAPYIATPTCLSRPRRIFSTFCQNTFM